MEFPMINRKDEIFMQRGLYIDKAHTALDIFNFAVFFLEHIAIIQLDLIVFVTIKN